MRDFSDFLKYRNGRMLSSLLENGQERYCHTDTKQARNNSRSVAALNVSGRRSLIVSGLSLRLFFVCKGVIALS